MYLAPGFYLVTVDPEIGEDGRPEHDRLTLCTDVACIAYGERPYTGRYAQGRGHQE
jgi:hypothetical protein